MKNKKKILVILKIDIDVRNFIASDLLSKIANRAEVLLVIPQRFVSILDKSILKKFQVTYLEHYQPNRFRAWWLDIVRTGSSFQRRTLNATYKAKARERILIYRNKVLFKRLLIYFPRHLLLFLLSFIFDLEKFACKIENLFRARKDTLGLIKEFRPDIVFSPTLIHEIGDVEIAKAAKSQKIPLVNFVSSWDNLTSKGFFLIRPDCLLVWGQADKDSAVNEHGFDEEQVFVTGAPHFDQYFNKSSMICRDDFLRNRGLDPHKKIILFAGTTLSKHINEPLILEKLSNYLLESNINNVLIWYRPHPRAMRSDAIKKLDRMTNIYVDDQIKEICNNIQLKNQYSICPDTLTHYHNLINSCEGVVSVFSTVAVEFALFGKPGILVNFNLDTEEIPSYAHISPLLNWKGLVVVNDFHSLTMNVKKMLGGTFKKYADQLQYEANKIAFNKDGQSQKRIINALLKK